MTGKSAYVTNIKEGKKFFYGCQYVFPIACLERVAIVLYTCQLSRLTPAD